jgi:hypothetical protein
MEGVMTNLSQLAEHDWNEVCRSAVSPKTPC